MPTVDGTVRTSRADRYLAQLCDHLDRMPHDGGLSDPQGADHRGHGSGVGHDRGHRRHGEGNGGRHASPTSAQRVERSGDHARIEFDWGRCVLTATPDALGLHLQAEDARGLAVGQELLDARIATIGRRDQLAVAWKQPDPGRPHDPT